MGGNPNGDPALLVHGRQDSAATFIPILEYLPDNCYYVALDLPGHGMSDPLPISLFYNAIYPNKIKKFIFFDPLPSLQRLQHTDPVQYYNMFYAEYYEHYNENNQNNRFLSKEKAMESVMRARGLSASQAEIVLSRNLKKVGDNLYRLSWDRRLKYPAPQNFPIDYYYQLFSNIPPTLIISATKAKGYSERAAAVDELVDRLKTTGNLTLETVEGNHDVHLVRPDAVAEKLLPFLKADHLKKYSTLVIQNCHITLINVIPYVEVPKPCRDDNATNGRTKQTSAPARSYNNLRRHMLASFIDTFLPSINPSSSIKRITSQRSLPGSPSPLDDDFSRSSDTDNTVIATLRRQYQRVSHSPPTLKAVTQSLRTITPPPSRPHATPSRENPNLPRPSSYGTRRDGQRSPASAHPIKSIIPMPKTGTAVRVETRTSEDFRALTRLRNVPYELPVDQNQENLCEQDFSVKSVHKIHNRARRPFPLALLILQNVPSARDIFNALMPSTTTPTH
ncbi:unnamed protein product [Diatraea saccharalis]|uniref:AB hydrolase-1 domain-containing protein n=1 Tax=Diatraea saccharalis TaxID=40085 RepID=A0A9N9R5H0_9NEOP|nr:unnamed protein product [Diatraea saccharalis]